MMSVLMSMAFFIARFARYPLFEKESQKTDKGRI
jgi:hypothetical protein